MNGLPPRAPAPMAPGIAGFSGGNPLRAIQGMKTAGAQKFNPSAPYASTLNANAPTMAERMAALGGNGFQRVPQTFTPDWQAQHPSNTGFNFDQILAGIPASSPRPAPSTPTGTSGGGAPPPNFAGAIQAAGPLRTPVTSTPLSNAVTSANGTMMSTAPRTPLLAPTSGIGTAETMGPTGSRGTTSGGFASALGGGSAGYSNAADPQRALKYMRGY